MHRLLLVNEYTREAVHSCVQKAPEANVLDPYRIGFYEKELTRNETSIVKIIFDLEVLASILKMAQHLYPYFARKKRWYLHSVERNRMS